MCQEFSEKLKKNNNNGKADPNMLDFAALIREEHIKNIGLVKTF